MLSREDFAEALASEIQSQLPMDYNLSVQTVMKSNDTPYTALNVTRENSNVGVVQYAENLYDLYRGGNTVEELADLVIDRAMDHAVDSESIPNISKEYVIEKVYFRMANAERNQKRFENVPVWHVPGAEDIVLYPCVDTRVGMNSGLITISNSHMEALGITKEQLHDAARANTENRVEIVPLGVLLQRMVPEMPMEAFDSPLYVTVDKEANNGIGGASLFGAPDKMKNLKGDYYIIPSSIHELLIYPKEASADTPDLHTIVHEVNQNVLEPSDFLSDNVYESKGGKISTLQNGRAAEKHMERA